MSSASQIDGNVPLDEEIDLLWCWNDMINVDAWPSDCGEVNEVLIQPLDFFTLHNP